MTQRCSEGIIMKRILVIGCPGSGKSTLAKQLAKMLRLPMLHLDRIYHIDNYHHIPESEFRKKLSLFMKKNPTFIIDGNYSRTLDLRLEQADTVILFDIPTEICLQNVLNRIVENRQRDDIAPGFDNSIYHQDFIDYVKTFRKEKQPNIEEKVKLFSGDVIRIRNYNDTERLLRSIRNKKSVIIENINN